MLAGKVRDSYLEIVVTTSDEMAEEFVGITTISAFVQSEDRISFLFHLFKENWSDMDF